MPKFLAWVARRISDLKNLFKSARTLRVGLHVAVPRFLRLALQEGFSPTEILNLGLLGDEPLIPVQRHYSKSRLLALQLKVNPSQYLPYVEDKLVFYQRCLEHGLATPRNYAVLSSRKGSEAGLKFATTPNSLLASLGTEPCDIAFKPVAGVYGEGLLLLHFDGEGFTASDGKAYSAEGLFTHAAQSNYADWLLQQRLFPHRELAALSRTQAMQPIRYTTLIDAGGELHVLHACFKIINGPSASDNFHYGLTGNFYSAVDLRTGRLEAVFGMRKDRGGLELQTHHPATGIPFESVVLPYMAESRDLIERAARAFAPLRTAGWDVALTDSGPSLLEGNATWDPWLGGQDLRAVASRLR